MTLPRIVGLHGLPRTGKDTLADQFVEHAGFVKLAFADPLYQEISDAFDVSVESLKSDEWKRKPQMDLEIRRCTDAGFIAQMRKLEMFLDEPMPSRSILQLWGTEYRRRNFGDDYWVGRMVGRIRSLGYTHDLVIPDVRETVEAAMGHWKVSRGKFSSFHVIELLRHGTACTGHSSDRGLSRFLIDATIRNTGAPDDMYHQACEALATGLGERTDG